VVGIWGWGTASGVGYRCDAEVACALGSATRDTRATEGDEFAVLLM
jgi:hypothetical protein